MLFLLIFRAPFGQWACGRFIDSGDSVVSVGAAERLRRRPAGEGQKKTAGFAGGFFGNFGCALRAINPLDPPAV
ncbi:hypothetical protein ABEG10_03615 [Burkholderia cenocepacia]|uniref:hypothetical protein n=1 Tax=Burkholderia cenocepacia TaxID=95486 RepID=UPI0020A1A348|nr:hypothetical protein [Burkholderia cenocepacia]MCO8322901.1 hypothetical protein [Burkholderia cenocepacia]MCO8330477.1 hypothetical protein [Burkholderia cenocepacia]MCO8337762.1 hypothetical protein [Burkholderia cenocepacia]MCO8344756.1 hypothetical protein [Burkholderia cenocepacia]MCO8358039.1 hypothetical protein [Burkholderia cenocepacia]